MGDSTGHLLVCLLASHTQHHTTHNTTQVTCGSTIKLAHASTGHRLHSHEVSYSRGSQQQSVTGFPASDNAGSYWSVVGTKVCVFVLSGCGTLQCGRIARAFLTAARCGCGGGGGCVGGGRGGADRCAP